jgi:hypothetical protein
LIQLGLYLAWTSRSVSRKDLISTAMARFSFCFSRKNGVISSFSLLYEYLTTTFYNNLLGFLFRQLLYEAYMYNIPREERLMERTVLWLQKVPLLYPVHC